MDLFSNINENEGIGFVPNAEPDLSHGKNNEFSKEAWSKVGVKGSRGSVLELIDGIKCTFEIANILGKPIHKISGRFTELKASGNILLSGAKEINGAKYSVYTAVPFQPCGQGDNVCNCKVSNECGYR